MGTWDTGRNAGGHNSFSNGNLTTSYTGTTGTDQCAYGTQFRAGGKRICTFTIVGNNGNTEVGFATSSASSAAAQYVGIVGNNSVGYLAAGTVLLNDVIVATGFSTFTTGDVVDLAIDLDASLIWGRVNSGNWNGSSANSPTTGVGGVSVSSLTDHRLSPACNIKATGDSITLNDTTPASISGFTSWSDPPNFGDLRGSISGSGASVTASNSIAGTAEVSIGDLIFVTFGEQTALTATGATDNLGNTYSAQNAGTDAGTPTGRSFWSRVTTAGTLTSVSIAATASADDYAGIGVAIAGPFASSPLDANPANITTDVTSPFTCPSTGTLVLGNEVVIAWGAANQSTVWAATSPNLLVGNASPSANIKVALGYQDVTSTVAVSPAFTAAANPTQSVLGTASFKNANVETVPFARPLSYLPQRYDPKPLTYYYSSSGKELPTALVAETNPNFIGKYSPTKLSTQFKYNSADQATTGPLPTQEKTNTNFLGRYQASYLQQFKYSSADSLATSETNTHFVGKYQSPYLQRFKYTSEDAASSTTPTQPTTDTYFIGKFNPPKLSQFNYNSTDTATVTAAILETNTSFVGRYNQSRLNQFKLNSADSLATSETNTHFIGNYNLSKLGYFKYNSADSLATAETNTNFLGKYQAPYLQRFKYNSEDAASSSLAPQPETNTNFIGRYSAPNLQNFKYRSEDAASSSTTTQPETNPHFVARYNQPKLSFFKYNYPADSLATVETNTTFVGRYAAPYLQKFKYTSEDTSVSGPLPAQPATNTHFIGRYQAPVLNKFKYTSEDAIFLLTIQEKTNTNFLGKYQAPYLQKFKYTSEDTSVSGPLPAQPETNVNFLGTYKAPNLQKFKHTSEDAIFLLLVQEKTNTNFIGKYQPATLQRFKYTSEDTSQSGPPTQVEVNTHFIGKYNRPYLQQFKYNSADSLATTETNQHFLGKYKLETYARIRLTSEDVRDFIPETNPHFIGRYRSVTLNKFFYQSAALDQPALIVAETNTHFIGKYNRSEFKNFKYNSADTSTAGPPPQPETNPHFIGKYKTTVYASFKFNSLPGLKTASGLPLVLPFDFTTQPIGTDGYKIGQNFNAIVNWVAGEFTGNLNLPFDFTTANPTNTDGNKIGQNFDTIISWIMSGRISSLSLPFDYTQNTLNGLEIGLNFNAVITRLNQGP